MIEQIITPGTLAAALRVATPLLLAALGGAICLKAGVFNIALEGLMLIGAFSAIILASYLNSLWLGIGLSILVTTLVSLVYAFVAITLKADQIISALGINMFALGLTSWLLQSVLNSPGGFADPSLPTIPVVSFPYLKDLPGLQDILQGQHLLTYLTWGLTLVIFLFVHRSKFGLRLRATGENVEAAKTVGIKTVFWKYAAVALSGVLSGLAGAVMTTGYLRLFTKGMTAGRGFIAFTAATFANGHIGGTSLVTLLFAFFSGVAIRMEGFGLPTHFVQMIPYLVTLVALVFARRRSV